MSAQDDLKAWEKWNSTKRNKDLSALMEQLQPIVMREVHKLSGGLPQSALNIRAQKLTHDAVKKFDPKRNVQLNTYLTHQLQPLKRFVYQHQNIAKIPESRIQMIGSYQRARERLRDDLNREPSDSEMADEMRLSLKQVSLLRREQWEDAIDTGVGSQIHGVHESNDKAQLMDFVYTELSPQEQLVFEKITGYNNTPVIKTNEQIATATGLTVKEVRSFRRKVAKRLQGFL